MNNKLTNSMVGLITAFSALITYVMTDISKDLKELNKNMSTVTEKTTAHEKRIDRLELYTYGK